MRGIDIPSIVSGAYDAALREELWTAWSEELFLALGGSGGLFGVHDTTNSELIRIISMAAPARSIDEYKSGYFQFDPQIPIVSRLSEPGVYVSSSRVEAEEKEVADYLKWQDDIAQMSYFQTAVMELGDSPYRASICIHKTRQLGPVTSDENRALRRIAPQIERALELAFRHNEMLQSAFWDGILVGHADQIAFLLDEHGRVLRQTDAADALIERRDGIDIVGRRLAPSLVAEAATLDTVVIGALKRAEPIAGSIRISRPSGKRPLILVCYPLQRRSRMVAPLEAAALVTIIDPQCCRRYRTDLHRQAFGLTTREAEMAAAILAGHSAESAAASLGISIATARTHLRRLFEKTETSGQAALVRRIISVG